MEIVIVDSDIASLEQLAASIRELFPRRKIKAFSDPLLAIQYAFSCKSSTLYTALEQKRATGFDVARLFRQAQGEHCVVHFIACDESLRRDAENFGAASYTVKPITAKKLREAMTAKDKSKDI
ncbi:MAG TPA: hypothetical protein PLT66_03130 [Bacillota bacterium]|nr:hypothetical protein [Bacillota bacterium]